MATKMKKLELSENAHESKWNRSENNKTKQIFYFAWYQTILSKRSLTSRANFGYAV